MRRPAFAILCSLFAAGVIACATATGEVSGGGGRGFDAAPPPAPVAEEPPVDEGSGTKWSDLYRDLFGPTGRGGSCSFKSNCHGTASSEGALSTAGVSCFDEKGCRTSFLEKKLVKPADKDDPGNSVLIAGLLRVRRADGVQTGYMPQEPTTYVFSDAAVERIKTWIANGAPDD